MRPGSSGKKFLRFEDPPDIVATHPRYTGWENVRDYLVAYLLRIGRVRYEE